MITNQQSECPHSGQTKSIPQSYFLFLVRLLVEHLKYLRFSFPVANLMYVMYKNKRGEATKTIGRSFNDPILIFLKIVIVARKGDSIFYKYEFFNHDSPQLCCTRTFCKTTHCNRRLESLRSGHWQEWNCCQLKKRKWRLIILNMW